MRILHINAYKKNGGAAIAVDRLAKAQRRAGHIADILTLSSDENSPPGLHKQKMFVRLLGYLSRKLSHFLTSDVTGFHSISILGAYNEKVFISFCLKYDIIHIHWVQNDQLTLKNIRRLSHCRPIYWTLHDMWPIGSFEHYYDHNKKFNFFERIYRLKKYRNFKDLTFIAPSKWMADKIKLFNDEHHVKHIPNTLDESLWCRKESLKKTSPLTSGRKIKVCFAALGGDSDPRKGADLLVEALVGIQTEVELHVVGGSVDFIKNSMNLAKVINYGLIDDEAEMRSIMSNSDVVVIPSRMDNLPNIGLEAIMLRVPVVAFKIGGMEDLIVDGLNGALVDPFDTDLFFQAVLYWGRKKIEAADRIKTHLAHFHEKNVVKMHLDLYESAFREKSVS